MAPTSPHAPAAHFARLIAMLCEAVGARIESPARPGLAGPLIILIWTRLRRLAGRVTRLAARVEAGTLTPPRNRTAAARTPLPRTPPRMKLPRGFAWLVRLVPASSCGAGQVQALLADPEMEALIAAAPQIGRSLRPLCHMLGVRPPPILRRPQPAPPTPPRPAEPGRPAPAEPSRAEPSRAEPSRAEPPRPHRPPPTAQAIARHACGPPLPA